MEPIKKILMCSVIAEAFYKSRFELIMDFLKRDYEVILVAPESEILVGERFGENMRIKYYHVSLERTGANPLADFRFMKDLQHIISSEKPGITYAFGGAKAAIYTTIAAAKAGVDRNFCMINGLGSVLRGKGLRNRLLGLIMQGLFKYSLSLATGVLFQNPDDLQEFVGKGLVDPKKTTIVNGSGVNLQEFPYTPVRSTNTFLFVGRLLKDKGIYEFVDAARRIKERYPGTEFWVVGGYDTNPTAISKDEMMSWVEAGILKYCGRQERVYPFYRDSSVFVLPSYHEGTPRTCLEAMAVGRPVITTDAPGCKETVVDGMTGFLVPVGDSKLLAQKMEFFILNPQEISAMGKKAYAFVKDKYEVNKVNRTIIDFLVG